VPTTSSPAGDYTIGSRLAPGTYRSKTFATPLTFTVPDGWKVFEDEPGQYGLALIENDGPCVCVWRDVRAMAATCDDTPEAGVGATARDITAWLAGHAGILATQPGPVTVGGLKGYVVDVSIDPAWTRACPFSQGRPAVPTLVGSGISAGVAWDVERDDRQRVYVVDLPPSGALGNIAINVDVCCEVDWGTRMAEVEPVLRSFAFSPG
jgi:hypothetical protein